MNGWYENAVESFARKGINWEADAIKAYPVGSGYVPNFATHDFVTVLAGNVVGSAVDIPNRLILDGAVLDGDDVVFSDVPSGAAVASVVVALDTGAAATSRLILFFDTGANFPMASTGGPISVQWDNGMNRIAKL